MKTRNLPLYILGGLITAGFFALLGILAFKGVPTENNQLFNTAMGVLLASFTAVVGYWFGSSKGSADKTDLLKKQE